MYYSDGLEVDGSWVLRVYVTDLQVERSLRVKGELHIGGVMLRLVEDLGEFFSLIKIKSACIAPFSFYRLCMLCDFFLFIVARKFHSFVSWNTVTGDIFFFFTIYLVKINFCKCLSKIKNKQKKVFYCLIETIFPQV